MSTIKDIGNEFGQLLKERPLRCDKKSLAGKAAKEFRRVAERTSGEATKFLNRILATFDRQWNALQQTSWFGEAGSTRNEVVRAKDSLRERLTRILQAKPLSALADLSEGPCPLVIVPACRGSFPEHLTSLIPEFEKKRLDEKCRPGGLYDIATWHPGPRARHSLSMLVDVPLGCSYMLDDDKFNRTAVTIVEGAALKFHFPTTSWVCWYREKGPYHDVEKARFGDRLSHSHQEHGWSNCGRRVFPAT